MIAKVKDLRRASMITVFDLKNCSNREHENKPLIGICTDSACPNNRLVCSKCIQAYHKSHIKEILAFEVLKDANLVTDNWPKESILRDIGTVLAKNINHESLEGDKKSLERQIEQTFEHLRLQIDEFLHQLKLQVKCEILDKPLANESKLERLKKTYVEYFDLTPVQKLLSQYLDAKMSYLEINYKLKEFFQRDRTQASEMIQYIYQTSKTKDLFGKLQDNYDPQTKVAPTFECDKEALKPVISQISELLSYDKLKSMFSLKYEYQHRRAPATTRLNRKELERYDQMYMDLEHLKPVYKLQQAHSDIITTIGIINVVENELGAKKYKSVPENIECVLVTGGEDATIKFWDLRTKKNFKTIKSAHKDWILSMKIFKCTDSESELTTTNLKHVVVTGSSDGSIRMWDWRSGGKLNEILEAHEGSIYNLEIMPITSQNLTDAKIELAVEGVSHLLVSASWDKKVKLWDWMTCICVKTIEAGIKICPFTLIPAFGTNVDIGFQSKDNFIIHAGWDTNSIKVWDWIKGECIRDLHGKCNRYDCITSLPLSEEHPAMHKGKTHPYIIALSGFNGKNCIEIWDIVNSKLLKLIESAHADLIKSLSAFPARIPIISENSQGHAIQWIIVSGGTDYKLKFWEWSSAEILKSYEKNVYVGREGSLKPAIIQIKGTKQFVLITTYEEGKSVVVFGEDKLIPPENKEISSRTNL